MSCVTCKRETQPTTWGPWCDACGGVSFKPGQLFFRHVATVYGPGGRYPIVFDVSTRDYAYMFKTPNPPSNKRDEDGFRRPTARVVHGTLDACIALAYPDVKGGPEEDGPSLAASPASTDEERQIMRL